MVSIPVWASKHMDNPLQQREGNLSSAVLLLIFQTHRSSVCLIPMHADWQSEGKSMF